ncbi:MAG: toprim domain-containing protein [Hyphomicrobiaceae bacterium]
MKDLTNIESAQASKITDAAAEFVEAKRSISRTVSERFVEIDSKFKGELLMRFVDRNGALSYRKRMRLMPDGKRDPQFENRRDVSGATTVPFNAEALLNDNQTLVITEGEFDCMAVIHAGLTNVISVPDGAPSKLGEGEINPSNDAKFSWLWDGLELHRDFKKYSEIILALDDDEAGHILREELAARLGRDRCSVVKWPPGQKDANDTLINCGAPALAHCIAEASPLVPDTTAWVGDMVFEDMPQGQGIGIPGFDEHCRTIDGDFINIVGLPNGGKSVVCKFIAGALAYYRNQPGTYLQWEDRDQTVVEELVQYFIGRKYEAGVPVDDELRDAARDWVNNMFRMKPFRRPSGEDVSEDLDWLLQTIRQDVLRHGCKWVLIDPWNQLAHSWNQSRMTETQYLEHAFRRINSLRKELGVTIIIAAHPDKGNATTRTFEEFNLYHVSGGQHWNNAADIGIVVARKNPNDPKDTTMQLKTCKIRQQSHRGHPGGGEWELVHNGMLLRHVAKGVGDDLRSVSQPSTSNKEFYQ